MTISSATPRRRPLAKLALVSTVSLGLLAGPVAFAGPASATAGHGDRDRVNCWVEAKRVDHRENYGNYSDNRNRRDKANVKFEFKVWCNKKTDVKYEHKIYQKNARGHWKEIGHDNGKINNVKHRPVWEYTEAEVKDHGPRGGHEKVFHIVKIKFDHDKKHAYSHAGGTVKFYR